MIAILCKAATVENPERVALVKLAAATPGDDRATLDKIRAKLRAIPHSLPVEAGTKIDHPHAYQLVLNGVAVPGDDECRERAGLDDAEIERRIARYKLIDEGLGVEVKSGRIITRDDAQTIVGGRDGLDDALDVLFAGEPAVAGNPSEE
jgi:hypothetical protein